MLGEFESKKEGVEKTSGRKETPVKETHTVATLACGDVEHLTNSRPDS